MTDFESSAAYQGNESMQSEPVRPTVHSVNVGGALREILLAGHYVTTGFQKPEERRGLCA